MLFVREITVRRLLKIHSDIEDIFQFEPLDKGVRSKSALEIIVQRPSQIIYGQLSQVHAQGQARDPRFPGGRFPECAGLTGSELSTCTMESLESQANERVSNITDGQVQSSEPVGTPVTSNETINAGIYVNSTRYEYLDGKIAGMGVYLEGLNAFGQVCSDYARLKVQTETDRCIEVIGEVYSHMSELFNRYPVLDKNIALAGDSLAGESLE